MKLEHIVLHQIVKEQKGKPSLKTSNSLLPVNNDTEEFVEKIIKSYSAKNPTYGVFEEDKILYPFQTYVEEYIENKDFLDFSLRSMEILKKEIDLPTTTGGYVVFIHYTENSKDFLITIMLDNSTSFSVNDVNLTIRKLRSLDIDRLARANRINFEKWKNKAPQYLSFIKGTRGISIYFQKFIGSTDMTSSRENSDKLKVAMASYMSLNSYTTSKKRDVFHKVGNYSLKKFEADEDIELKAISALMDEQNPEDFLEWVTNNNEIEVSGSFRVTQKSHLKFLNKEIIKEKGYLLEFDRGLIGSKIRKNGSTIVIRDVPAELLRNL
ncbi:hypothetical protein F8C76_11230 [Flagellimonas olearia]|uniref:Nucleoid-associated protein n=1 Tax=Flagellimonas olearia TaxID=552546 RepID=A0A6I1DUH3_9FLAO|nr:nucleoid-associated protein [Allomuricauda olearia]KAB7528428.1 hypothetical protein F8C76_11230 [Allomuricauda olearia]